jgi:hypothetical protein
MNTLIAFCKGDMVHPDGYTLDGILSEDDSWLERKHNYIQWLFPLNKPSDAVPGSPIISEQEIELFRTDAGLKSKLMFSFQRMLQFYGFKLESDSDNHPRVVKTQNFDKCISNWLSPQNHNFKRITRILESLTLLGLPDMALIFFDALRKIYIDDSATIGRTTYRYWEQAVGN